MAGFPSKKDGNNETALHFASKNNYSYQSKLSILQAYYTACSRINDNIKRALVENNFLNHTFITSERHGFLIDFRPLHLAVTFQVVDVMPILIENGVDLGTTDSNGMTALHSTLQQMQCLLHTHYLPTIFSQTRDAIHEEKLAKIIGLLLKHGCDINALDRFGRTPIFHLFNRLSSRAEIEKKFFGRKFLIPRSIIETLLSFSPNLLAKDNDGNTILHAMAQVNDDFYMMHALLIAERYFQVGGNPNEFNNRGYTALHYACENGFTNLVYVLLNNGAEVNLARPEDRERPIHAAVRYLARTPKPRKIALLQRLHQRGAYVDAERTDGMNPILLATCPDIPARNGPLILCLLNWGCDVNSVDAKGRTPLHNVCQLKDLHLIEKLLCFGADVNAKDALGFTPFSIAFRWTNFDLFNSLDIYKWLKKLTILGVPLSNANRRLYACMERMTGDMAELGRILVEIEKLRSEISSRQYLLYQQKLKEVPTETQCRAELDLLKNVSIDKNTKLLDILRANTVAFHYPREENTNLLADTSYSDEDYPVYGYLLKIKLRKTNKGILLYEATQLMKQIFQANVTGVFDCIFSYLSHEDLLNFVAAGKNK